MKRFKLFGLAFAAILAIGVMTAAAASATLPVIQQAATASGSLTSTDTLETISGSKLTGTSVELSLTNGAKTALGTYSAKFKGVKEGTQPCKTSGAAKEEVVNTGEFHLVWANSGKTEISVLFLPTGFTIECGEPAKTKIKVKGQAVGKTSLALGTKVKTFTGTLEGKNGKNNITSYFNTSGTLVEKAFLESNFGLGYEQSDENVSGALTLTVAAGGEIEVKAE
jgi:hypothetical protein